MPIKWLLWRLPNLLCFYQPSLLISNAFLATCRANSPKSHNSPKTANSVWPQAHDPKTQSRNPCTWVLSHWKICHGKNSVFRPQKMRPLLIWWFVKENSDFLLCFQKRLFNLYPPLVNGSPQNVVFPRFLLDTGVGCYCRTNNKRQTSKSNTEDKAAERRSMRGG